MLQLRIIRRLRSQSGLADECSVKGMNNPITAVCAAHLAANSGIIALSEAMVSIETAGKTRTESIFETVPKQRKGILDCSLAQFVCQNINYEPSQYVLLGKYKEIDISINVNVKTNILSIFCGTSIDAPQHLHAIETRLIPFLETTFAVFRETERYSTGSREVVRGTLTGVKTTNEWLTFAAACMNLNVVTFRHYTVFQNGIDRKDERYGAKSSRVLHTATQMLERYGAEDISRIKISLSYKKRKIIIFCNLNTNECFIAFDRMLRLQINEFVDNLNAQIFPITLKKYTTKKERGGESANETRLPVQWEIRK